MEGIDRPKETSAAASRLWLAGGIDAMPEAAGGGSAEITVPADPETDFSSTGAPENAAPAAQGERVPTTLMEMRLRAERAERSGIEDPADAQLNALLRQHLLGVGETALAHLDSAHAARDDTTA
jgi:hypothetical protein